MTLDPDYHPPVVVVAAPAPLLADRAGPHTQRTYPLPRTLATTPTRRPHSPLVAAATDRATPAATGISRLVADWTCSVHAPHTCLAPYTASWPYSWRTHRAPLLLPDVTHVHTRTYRTPLHTLLYYRCATRGHTDPLPFRTHRFILRTFAAGSLDRLILYDCPHTRPVTGYLTAPGCSDCDAPSIHYHKLPLPPQRFPAPTPLPAPPPHG